MLRRRMGQRLSRANKQPVTILDLALLVAGDRQLERLVHELDAEVEGAPGRNQAIEAILGLGLGTQGVI